MISSIALFPKSMNPEKIEELLSKQIASMKAANGLQSLKMSDGHQWGCPAFL